MDADRLRARGVGLQEGREGARAPARRSPQEQWSEDGPKDVCAVLDVSYNTAIRLMEKMPSCVKIVKKNPGGRPKRTRRISGMRFKEWMRNHPANP